MPKLNQCQDCGCTGAQIQIKKLKDYSINRAWGWATCPYCGRSSPRIELQIPEPGVRYDISEVVNSWNSMNRENKEGLG